MSAGTDYGQEGWQEEIGIQAWGPELLSWIGVFSVLPSVSPLRWLQLALFRDVDLEIFHECLLETVNLGKMLSLVRFRLFHHPDVDQVVDDLSEITCSLDAPVVEHGFRHVTELVNGKQPDCLAELLAGQGRVFPWLWLFLGQHFLCKGQ